MVPGQAAPRRRIAVLTDRASSELLQALEGCGYDVTAHAPEPDVLASLTASGADAAFIDCAPDGGRLQGALETIRLPYTQSGVLATALGANRHQRKIVLRAAGLPVTDHVVVDAMDLAAGRAMAPPYVLKPVVGGSAPIIVANTEEEQDAVSKAREWGGHVLLEQYLPGWDLACAVQGNVALGVTVLPRPSHCARLAPELPAISSNVYDTAQKMSLAAHEALGCRGVTLVKFRYNDRLSGEGALVFVSIDTHPDLGAGSVVSRQVLATGQGHPQMLAWIVEDASCNR